MATLVTPYIVRGCWMVSWGVLSRGVSGPKEPIEEGVNTAQPFRSSPSEPVGTMLPTPMWNPAPHPVYNDSASCARRAAGVHVNIAKRINIVRFIVLFLNFL